MPENEANSPSGKPVRTADDIRAEYEPFYSRILKTKPSDAGPEAEPPASKTKLLFWDFGANHLSHTLGIDLIFLGVIAFAI